MSDSTGSGGLNPGATAFVPANQRGAPAPQAPPMNANAPAFVPRRAHPPLPAAVVPPGYVLYRDWHWGFDVWAHNDGVHWQGHQAGEQPHYNIQPAGGMGNTLHVYLIGGTLLVVDMAGVAQARLA